MTLGEFSQGLQQHGCDLIDGGLFNGYRAVIARRETDRVRLFVFLDEGQDVARAPLRGRDSQLGPLVPGAVRQFV